MRDRFFVEGVHAVGDTLQLADDDARKLTTVLRKATGDRVQIVDSSGTAYAATLTVDNRRVDAKLDAIFDRGPVESNLAITIAQGIPKGSKMDLIVEKCTELGAAEFVPVRSFRVVGERTGDHKIERWQRIAKSAAQQSGRTAVPTVAPIATWDQLIATFSQYDHVYLPWELADPAELRSWLPGDLDSAKRVMFVIGPEGGFSSDEVERASKAGAKPISLGRRILRTETAALAILAVVAYARGEM